MKDEENSNIIDSLKEDLISSDKKKRLNSLKKKVRISTWNFKI
jgi:hypothetical protein